MTSHEDPPSVVKRLKNRALLFDSWLTHRLYAAWDAARAVGAWMQAFSSRFRVTGWQRAGVELSCDGLTLGVVAALVALILALPAFNETKDDWLKRSDVSVTFEDRYGTVIGQRGARHNDTVPLNEMPDYVIKAVLSTEDRRFYDHFGIDVIGTLRALTVNTDADGVVQGGSSITQQLAKNLFLSNQRTLQRKIKEAWLALWLEGHLSKDEILKLYLDRAYMGGGTFGIEAAAQHYFGKSVRDVSLAEAAMLAGLFKAPSKYAPTANLAAARGRANQVLANLVDAGFMTEGEVYGARRAPATPVIRSSSVAAPDFYLDWAYTQVRQMAADNKLGNQSVVVVKTGLDPTIQAAADDALETTLREYGRNYRVQEGAIVIMDPDGTVRAMVGGRDYSQSQFNRATDALRQPGSTFKPFVYLTALMNGFTPQSVVMNAPVCIRNWCPQNFDRKFTGPITLANALARSINVIPVRLSLALGRNGADGRRMIIETAHRMGIQTPLKESWALPIGVEAVNLLEMTGAYGTFASGGRLSHPHAATDIYTIDGELIYRFDAGLENPQVMEPRLIAQMNGMMANVVAHGTARRAELQGIEAAGKTGTTNAYRDAWFMGFTGNFVGGVWFGNDNYHPTNKMTGGSLPAITWQKVMAVAHRGIDLKPIPGIAAPQMAKRAPEPPAAAQAPGAAEPEMPERPRTLSRGATDTLGTIETLIDGATEPSKSAAVNDGARLPGARSRIATRSPARQRLPSPAPPEGTPTDAGVSDRHFLVD